MPAAFSRSLRAIEGDGSGVWRWATPLILFLLVGWGAWMVRAEVPLYAASTSARLVRERAVYPIQSAVAGRVLAVHAGLDRPVEAGALLLELDAGLLELEQAEERARLAALEAELTATRAALTELEQARTDARSAAGSARREAELELETRQHSLRYAEEEAQRLTQLEQTGDVAKLSASKARTEAEKAGVAVRAQEATLVRLTEDARRDDQDRAAAVADRRRGLVEREGARGVLAATLERLAHERELYRVRAPAAGVVGELARLAPGARVEAGQDLGAIVAEGRLAAEAEFEPAEALGKVRLGQQGELVLSGFPRAEYGTLRVQVERIASEARAGRIRVELALLQPERARMPLEHNLPGTLAIEVERTHPAALVLRAVGGVLGLGSPGG